MKLTKRILTVVVMLALLVSGFAFTSSAEFTEDNIDDILEYYDYHKYVKEDFNSLKADVNEYCPALNDDYVEVDLKTDKASVVVDSDDAKNSYLQYYYVTEDNDSGYFAYDFSLKENVAEAIFTMKVYAEKGAALTLPTYSINLGAFDADGNAVGERSIVTPISFDFASGEVYYSAVSANDETRYVATPLEDIDFLIESGAWYTVTLFFNGESGFYNFVIESEAGDVYESEEISLGAAAYINDLSISFTTHPMSSGVTCAFDDIEFYQGTFIRGDVDLDEIAVTTLYDLATFVEENEIEDDVKLKIIKIYEYIRELDFNPDFSNKYDAKEVEALYEAAMKYIPAAYTELFCSEAETIDSNKSFALRQDKLAELKDKYFDKMNGEDFYFANINDALTVLENSVFNDFDAAIKAQLLKYDEDGLTEDDIKALDEELEEIKKAKSDAEDAFSAYKMALSKKENADSRVDTLEGTISGLTSDFEEAGEYVDAAIEIITENEELLAKLRTALDAYDAEVKKLDEVEKDSKAFISYMKTYDPESRDYAYILDAYAQLLEYKLRDNSYNYVYGVTDNKDSVYYYIKDFNELEKKVAEATTTINQFREGVATMQKPGADFNTIFNVGYLSAKEVYNDGKICDKIDIATVTGLADDIAAYLEIEKGFAVTIEASENFIKSVNTAEFNTLYESKKAALAAAQELLKTDTNINAAYPGVSDAIKKIDSIKASIEKLESDAAAYIAAVSEIGNKKTFNAKKNAINNAIKLQTAGNVVGIAGVAEANSALANYSAEIQILEGNSKTFIESVEKLDDATLTLAERRALIIIADGAKAGAEATYDGVEEAKAALAEHKINYAASVEAINSAFSGEVANAASVAGASVNQSRYYAAIELIKLLVASFK